MIVGYVVPINPILASFRLRVAIPAAHMELPYYIGHPGDVSFFFKDAHPLAADGLRCVVYDVVNDHFTNPNYRAMCALANTITTASAAMAETVLEHTGRHATVIDDPYEDNESEVRCKGHNVLWFGHSANLSSLPRHLEDSDIDLTICSNWAKSTVQWSRQNEMRCLSNCAVALVTGNNPGASSNRIVKAIRAGRFVVAPRGVSAWEQFEPYIWLGDVQKGIRWAFNNREEACRRTLAGQEYIRERFSPKAIGKQWKDLFCSTLAAATSGTKAGSGSIERTRGR